MRKSVEGLPGPWPAPGGVSWISPLGLQIIRVLLPHSWMEYLSLDLVALEILVWDYSKKQGSLQRPSDSSALPATGRLGVK